MTDCMACCRLQRNIIQAASEGASQAVRLAANIAVNLIAFVALLELLNSTLTWLGDRVGIDNLTFQVVCVSRRIVVIFGAKTFFRFLSLVFLCAHKRR